MYNSNKELKAQTVKSQSPRGSAVMCSEACHPSTQPPNAHEDTCEALRLQVHRRQETTPPAPPGALCMNPDNDRSL